MTNQTSGKELVSAGHAFAKAISMDTPLIVIAKMVSDLSTRLDCAIVRGDEWEKRAINNFQACAEMDEVLRSVSAENSELNSFIKEECFVENKRTGIYQCAGHCRPLTPSTESVLNSLRAEGVEMFREELGSPYGDYDDKCYETGFNRAIEVSKNKAFKFASQLRSGTHDTAKNAKDAQPVTLTALPVERDQYGYWSHPEYLAFCDGRENIPSAEFNQWMESKGMEWLVDYRDEEEIEPNVDCYDLSSWNPQAPAGDGWFVASIHDTEDGAVCIWLRATAPKGDSDE